MTDWIRGTDDVWWHVGRVARSGMRATLCGVDVGGYAIDSPWGRTPPDDERCLTCGVRLVMDLRRKRLIQALRIDRVLAAYRSSRR
jgi:hypothetical protein